jgi:hypothetical protein
MASEPPLRSGETELFLPLRFYDNRAKIIEESKW